MSDGLNLAYVGVSDLNRSGKLRNSSRKELVLLYLTKSHAKSRQEKILKPAVVSLIAPHGAHRVLLKPKSADRPDRQPMTGSVLAVLYMLRRQQLGWPPGIAQVVSKQNRGSVGTPRDL